MTAAAERCIARIEKSTAPSLNMADEMVRATFEVISDVTFSGGDAFDRDAVHSAIDAYIAEAGKISLFDVLGFPDWVPRPNRLISSSAMRQTKAIADQAIDARRHQLRETGLDLLDLLLAGEDPKSQRKMDTGELRDNLLTFIVAGHETTALTLSWALYLCAFDQDIQEQARTQAKAVLGDRIATAEDVAQLPFISQIVDETLRLYPPAGIISRTALSHDTLCDRDIQPKDTVMIPIYALHRNHLIWDNPDQFDPTRFANRRSIPRYGYLPFGDGPRICIGASFALQEAVIILASLLAKFKFTPVTGRDPKPVMILTLRPEGGVWLKPEPV
jgi:cytochrome P450